MKWASLFFVIFIINSFSAQDKFLELTVSPRTEDGKALRKFSMMVVTTDGTIFEIETKRKKSTFYLPAGEFYRLKVIKDGYFKSHLEIDLKKAPSSDSKSHSLTLEPKLISSNQTQKNTLRKYKYEPRYGKIIRVFDEE